MSIEKLKEQARRHEQKEEWQKALDQYQKAISKLAEEDQPDIGLYNRVGDLFVRVGKLDQAVDHYEQAVDLYMEAELPNNAIAVCKKVIRNVPDRYQIYLKMGQIRAQQGFLPDARTNFLTYAERAAQAEDQEESLRALVEFTRVAGDDVEMRMFVAEQLAAHDRPDEAVEQLHAAYHHLQGQGATDQLAAVEARVQELAPGFDLSAAPAAGVAVADAVEDSFSFEKGSGLEDADAIGGQFGEIQLGGEEGDTDEPAAAPEPVVAAPAAEADAAEEAGLVMEDFEIAGFDSGSDGGSDEDEEDDGGAFELPMMDMGDDDADEDVGGDLPMMDVSFGDDGDDEGADLPLMDMGEDEEEDGGDLPLMDMGGDEEDGADLPLMGMGGDDEVGDDLPLVDAAAEAGEEEGAELHASDFGLTDPGARADQDYIDGPQEMGVVDVGLSDLGGADEPAEDEGAPGAASGGSDAGERVAAASEDARSEGSEELGPEELRARIVEAPDDISLHQRLVEVCYASGDEGALAAAYLGLGDALTRTGQSVQAKAAYRQVLVHDPGNAAAQEALGRQPAASKPVQEVAATEEYVDLGAMILGDDEEKSTRFVVAYEEPSGDEQADFAKMLSQFKEKVSENLDADDVRAHHDLGTAYKEMGLLEEAIAEFQQALRAKADHLPTFELMGQTFMEMGNADQAVRTLERALTVEYEVEDELLGIYYHLGRAYEEQGSTEKAVEFYDRVFSLDINFADVTERLRALR